MIEIIKATNEQIDIVMRMRLETLRMVNHLPNDAPFSEELIKSTASYLKTQDQTTLLAMDDQAIGCATICYITAMPTPGHPSGKRAHLMNVYVRDEYRRQGIARRMIAMLIAEAKQRGVTEMTLDATDDGRPLYETCGFVASDECMFLDLFK